MEDHNAAPRACAREKALTPDALACTFDSITHSCVARRASDMAARTASEDVNVASEDVAAPGLPTQVLDALDQVVVALDRDRRILYANRRTEELLGLSPESLV